MFLSAFTVPDFVAVPTWVVMQGYETLGEGSEYD